MTTFMSAPSLFLSSESVTEGHPDKVCDIISDAVLDAILAQDPMARVACETAATTGLVIVMGEITTACYIEIQDIVREVLRDIGYTRAKYGFDCDTCGVMVSIKEQSKDIDMGVSKAMETREEKEKKDEIDHNCKENSQQYDIYNGLKPSGISLRDGFDHFNHDSL